MSEQPGQVEGSKEMNEQKPVDLEAIKKSMVKWGEGGFSEDDKAAAERIEDTDPRLKEFGYIKGGYMWGHCYSCKKPLEWVQKRCWHCFECASKMLLEKLNGTAALTTPEPATKPQGEARECFVLFHKGGRAYHTARIGEKLEQPPQNCMWIYMREVNLITEAARVPPEATPSKPDPLLEAAKALVNKLQQIHANPIYQGVWSIAQIHTGPYNGPTYVDELSELEKAIEAQRKGEP